MTKKKLGLGGGLGQFRSQVKDLTVLPELKAFIPDLTEEETKLLEESIKADGVREPIDVWIHEDKHIIIDGHNRYGICLRNKISFTTNTHTFESIDQVKEWMLKKQLGRRNLSDLNRTYLIGLLYNKSKTDKGSYKRNGNEAAEKKSSTVAETIAEQTGSSVRSVKNAGDLADGIEKLSPEFKNHILSGKEKVPKANLQKLAKSEAKEPIEGVKQLEKEVSQVEAKKQPKEAVKNDPKQSVKKDKKKDSKASNEPEMDDSLVVDDEYADRYSKLRGEISKHLSAVDDTMRYFVLSDLLEIRGNATDFAKLVDDGYIVLRSADHPTIRIMHMHKEKKSWVTLEKDFKSKAARDRRFKELLEDSKTIRG